MKVTYSLTQKRKKRLSTYSLLTNQLTLLSDQSLIEILKKTEKINSSMNGVTSTLMLENTAIFIKKIRLTDIEQQPQNKMSTANLFELPLYYQYGISSAGFGAWRELTTHLMTTQWVLTNECSNFPLMYHWRILPSTKPKTPTANELKEIERSVKYWGNSPAIRTRLEAKQNASADIVLFLEYIPDTLNKWLGKQIIKNNQDTQSAISMVEDNLIAITSFMKSQGLSHFDAHFENILTDGSQLYFTDFGLATSSHFELSKLEIDFFNLHRDYDLHLVIASLVNRILAATFESKERNFILQQYAVGNDTIKLPSLLAPTIIRYATIAMLMKNFNQALVNESKTTPYPATQLAQACITANIIQK